MALIAALMGGLIAHVKIKVLAHDFGSLLVAGVDGFEAIVLPVDSAASQPKDFRHVGDEFGFGPVCWRVAVHQTGESWPYSDCSFVFRMRNLPVSP